MHMPTTKHSQTTVLSYSTNPTAARGQSANAGDQLRKILFSNVGHSAECQQLVDDDETTVEKFRFHAVSVVVQKTRVGYLHTPQIRLDNQTVACTAIIQRRCITT